MSNENQKTAGNPQEQPSSAANVRDRLAHKVEPYLTTDQYATTLSELPEYSSKITKSVEQLNDLLKEAYNKSLLLEMVCNDSDTPLIKIKRIYSQVNFVPIQD